MGLYVQYKAGRRGVGGKEGVFVLKEPLFCKSNKGLKNDVIQVSV